jgi:hypothetical protein
MVDPTTPLTSDRPIRVFILDDHELVRRGLTDLLETTDDLIIVGEAGTAADALHRIPAAAPMSPCLTRGCRTAAASTSAGKSAPPTRTCGA